MLYFIIYAFVFGIVLAVGTHYSDGKQDDDAVCAIAFMWPIILAAIVAASPFILGYYLTNLIINRINK